MLRSDDTAVRTALRALGADFTPAGSLPFSVCRHGVCVTFQLVWQQFERSRLRLRPFVRVDAYVAVHCCAANSLRASNRSARCLQIEDIAKVCTTDTAQ